MRRADFHSIHVVSNVPSGARVACAVASWAGRRSTTSPDHSAAQWGALLRDHL